MEVVAGLRDLDTQLSFAAGSIDALINDVVDAARLFKETRDDFALARFMRAFNEYLEAVSPLEYIPGLIEELGKLVELRLWDVEFSYDALRSLLKTVYELKTNGLSNGDYRSKLLELAELLAYFMNRLGVPVGRLGGFNGLLGCKGCWTSEPSLMVTAAMVFLILATNLD